MHELILHNAVEELLVQPPPGDDVDQIKLGRFFILVYFLKT